MTWFRKKRDGAMTGWRRWLFIVIMVAFVVTGIVSIIRSRRFSSGRVVLANGSVVRVDVAMTDSTRERGLSVRESLPVGEGMLFVFPNAERYGFWMKGMRFPIDIVWLDGVQVVGVVSDVPVPRSEGQYEVYRPPVPVTRVLELPAGQASAQGIAVGDRLEMALDGFGANR